MIDRTKYPELAKLDDLHVQKTTISDFMEWLSEQRIDLCTADANGAFDRWAPITDGAERLVARYLGLDLNLIERERRAMLASLTDGVKEKDRG